MVALLLVAAMVAVSVMVEAASACGSLGLSPLVGSSGLVGLLPTVAGGEGGRELSLWMSLPSSGSLSSLAFACANSSWSLSRSFGNLIL